MWKEAALLAAGCVLFINMGLSDAIQDTIGIHSKILSCPKCLCFWSSLAFLVFNRCRIVTAVPASFILSYLALWLDLGLSALNKIYNELYEQIAAKTGTPDANPPDKPKHTKADSANVSKMRRKK